MPNPLYDSLLKPHENNQAVLFDNTHSVHSPGNISYAEFVESAARCANTICSAGLKPGDRLIAQIGKSIASLSLYAGCVQAGVVYLPLNTAYTSSEVEYFVQDSGASLLVCSPDAAAELQSVADRCNTTLMTQADDGLSGTFIEQVNTAPNQFVTVDRQEDDIAALLYTSGTTGRSKGAMLTQQNLLSNAMVLQKLWAFTENDVLLHALPVFHTHGLFVASNVILLSGGRMLYEPGFNVDRLIDLLPHATTMMGVPTFYTRLLADDRFNQSLTKNMRLFISGSAPLLSETHVQFEQVTGHRILERYGMTETNMNTSNPYDGERRAGTVGFPLPGVELKITHPDTGEIVPEGDVGLIEVKGENVFKGYWNMPEKTAEELRDNGFFVTGDLGHIDADGYVSIVGRNKDLIISGGYNIYPKEIELVLDEQPGVIESAVIGVPHPDFGETVVGVIAGKEADVDMASLSTAIEAALARFKHPRKLVFVDALPRNAMSKVQKNELREQFRTLFQ